MSTVTQAATPASATTAQAAPQGATRWNIDTVHSVAQFTVRHMMVTNVRGQFSGVAGTVVFGSDLTQAQVNASVDVGTVDTREAKRDAHLRSPDFFDVEKYPTMTFVSKRVESVDGLTFKLRGDLAMHGVTKEVVLDVELSEAESKDPYGNIRRGASASVKLNRKDYGLGWNVVLETGGIAVSEQVKIDIELSLIKAG